MTVAVIVQARFGSSRLPGKTLMDLGGASALVRCLDRVSRIPQVDIVVCATPETADGDGVSEEAERAGYAVVRGSESDVLARYAKAARAVHATTVMRVTSDCPFIDPAICAQTLQHYRQTRVEYGCNTLPPRFPHGLDCEVFSAELLHAADRCASLAYEREHVTPWIRKHPHVTKSCLVGPGGGFERLRWTLDYPEDLEFCRAVFDAMGPRAAEAGAAEIAALLLRRQDILQINEHRIDQARLQLIERADIISPPISLALAA